MNEQVPSKELVEAATFAAGVLAEMYAKYSIKIGPFASQAQKANGMLRAALKSASTCHEPGALHRELLAARVILEQIEAHCANGRGLAGIDHADDGRRLRAGLQAFLATPSSSAAPPPSPEQWQPISKKPPSCLVLVATSDGVVMPGDYAAGKWWEYGRPIDGKVTHWKPWPSPPASGSTKPDDDPIDVCTIRVGERVVVDGVEGVVEKWLSSEYASIRFNADVEVHNFRNLKRTATTKGCNAS